MRVHLRWLCREGGLGVGLIAARWIDVYTVDVLLVFVSVTLVIHRKLPRGSVPTMRVRP
jgi:hypothetical protein